MNILLIGASGMVGSRVLSEAVARGHSVVAAGRNPDKIEQQDSVHAIALDVEDSDAVLAEAANADVVISAVSPRNSGDAIQDAINFTTVLIKVSEQTGKRILMVGGGSSLVMPDGTSALELTPDFILPEATGMRKAYAMMVDADIDFTVLAPGGMIEPGERTGKFRTSGRIMLTNAEGGKSRITAEDYAIAMLDEVENPKHYRSIFNVAY